MTDPLTSNDHPRGASLLALIRLSGVMSHISLHGTAVSSIIQIFKEREGGHRQLDDLISLLLNNLQIVKNLKLLSAFSNDC
jgi:hypothetical protein